MLVEDGESIDAELSPNDILDKLKSLLGDVEEWDEPE